MITFRKITEKDLEFINTVRNLYSERYLHDSRKFTIQETNEWFIKNKPDYYLILLLQHIDGVALAEDKIGYFRLSNYSVENKNIYIGADISPNYRGMGYAKLAYSKFIPFLFNDYNLNKISLEVLSTNEVAINLYKKLGFVKEGIKRQEVYKNGEWVDSIIMSILKEEYEKT